MDLICNYIFEKLWTVSTSRVFSCRKEVVHHLTTRSECLNSNLSPKVASCINARLNLQQSDWWLQSWGSHAICCILRHSGRLQKSQRREFFSSNRLWNLIHVLSDLNTVAVEVSTIFIISYYATFSQKTTVRYRLPVSSLAVTNFHIPLNFNLINVFMKLKLEKPPQPSITNYPIIIFEQTRWWVRNITGKMFLQKLSVKISWTKNVWMFAPWSSTSILNGFNHFRR